MKLFDKLYCYEYYWLKEKAWHTRKPTAFFTWFSMCLIFMFQLMFVVFNAYMYFSNNAFTSKLVFGVPISSFIIPAFLSGWLSLMFVTGIYLFKENRANKLIYKMLHNENIISDRLKRIGFLYHSLLYIQMFLLIVVNFTFPD